jgi:adenine/guanine/hypoxanthine permease
VTRLRRLLVLMAASLGRIEWHRIEIAIPAFATMIVMPLAYSIADGIAFGLVLFPLTMAVLGRWREVHPLLYALAVVVLVYFAFLAEVGWVRGWRGDGRVTVGG